MDQVLGYMDRQVIRFDEADGLTAAMVNNYTKSGLVPRAKGKKYDRDHLAYLTVICILKHVMSTKDMDFLIREELQGARGIPDGYAAFCESLDSALNAMADEVASREENEIKFLLQQRSVLLQGQSQNGGCSGNCGSCGSSCHDGTCQSAISPSAYTVWEVI